MGTKQLGFSDYEQSTAKRRTRKEIFLSEMDAVVPWQALVDLIDPHYPKTEVGAFYWTDRVPDIVNPGREGQDPFSV